LGLGDCSVEKAIIAAAIGRKLQRNTAGACRVAPEDYMLWIAAKFDNVVVDPIQCHALIFQPIVEAPMVIKFRTGEETVSADTIID